MDKFQLYDKMLAVVINNILLKSQKNGNIVLLKFNPKNKSHMLVLKCAQISLMNPDRNRDIYLHMNIFKYLWFKYRKGQHFSINWYKVVEEFDNPVNIDYILEDIAKEFEVNVDIFEEIYDEYYA